MEMAVKQPKLTDNFIKAAKSILNHNMNTIIHTDEELLSIINEKLPENQRVAQRTFAGWISMSDKKNIETDEISQKFLHIIKKARTKQKCSLFESLINEPKQWQKYAWLIERKFKEWNIRIQQDHHIKGEMTLNQVIEEKTQKAKGIVAGL